MPYHQLAKQLHEPIIQKYYRQYLGCWSCQYILNK